MPGRTRAIATPDFTFRVLNFKSITSVELPHVRLAVLAGSNSSGKSALLQAVLFAAQSLSASGIVINGDLVRLGVPHDVLRDGTDELSFEFAFATATGEEDEARVAVRTTLHAEETDLVPARLGLTVDDQHVLEAVADGASMTLKQRLVRNEKALRVSSPGDLKLPKESFLSAVGLEPGRLVYEASPEPYRAQFDQAMEGPQSRYFVDELLRLARTSGAPASVKRVQDLLRRFRRSPLSRIRSFRADSLTPEDREALFAIYYGMEAPDGWASESVSLPPLGGARTGFRAPGLRLSTTENAKLAELVSHLRDATQRMEAFAASVAYLGPLRDEPRVAYPLGHTIASLPVGEKGEFTAAYLERNSNTRTDHVNPSRVRKYEPLGRAVSTWCRYLGIADDVTVEPRGKLGHELSLSVGGRRRDPTAIGVGASQLLPVVVLVLGARSGSLVLLEQPELHLHPRVQSRLADFFAWARPDVRLLLETHSEYLITRMRLRAAQDYLDASDVAVMFVTKRSADVQASATDKGEPASSSEDDHASLTFSNFQRLNLGQFGDFDAWPDDFFDSLDQDTVDLAHAVTDRLEQQGQNELNDDA